MNLLLHGIGHPEGDSLITVDDALRAQPSDHFDMVLTNPPFGKKSSYKVITAEGDTESESMSYLREDFWATTSNKQLNFLQHVRSLLKINGRAAIVVPDNVLFEGGAGETVRRRLLEQCDVHTLLRLPTGIFFAGGVKANVLFFDRKPPSETALDPETLGLRLPYQPELHTQNPAAHTCRPRRLRRLLQSRQPPGRARRPSASAPSPTTSSSPATRPPSTSSGSATHRWRTSTTSRRPMSLPPRSSRTSKRRWSSFALLLRVWRRA